MTCSRNHRARRLAVHCAFALAFALAGCTEDTLPTSPDGDALRPAASLTAGVAIQLARASLDDAVNRILPGVDEAALPPGLQSMLAGIADRLDDAQPGTIVADLARAQAMVGAFDAQAATGIAPELDAIALALDATRRAIDPLARP